MIGKGGLSLREKWADGMSTFQGFYSRGFPNCFFMMGLQSGLTPNIPHAIDVQARHLSYIIEHLRDSGKSTVEPREADEKSWVKLIHDGQAQSDFFETCTPGYYNNEGKPGEGEGWFGGGYPGGSEAFFQMLREWRADGTLAGLDIA